MIRMTKKIILFIVEGNHDRSEMNAILKTPYFDEFRGKYRIEFDVTHGDITTVTGNDETNIVDAVGKRITSWIRDTIGVRHNDIERVIHILDTDGAFIPESCVVLGEVYDYVYNRDTLAALDVNSAKKRNRRKSGELLRLCSTKEIRNIKYEAYYMSCNMDHTLFNNRNMNDRQKSKSNTWFVKACEENPRIIFDSILNEKIASRGSFDDSWEWIQRDTRSLWRHTNINLFLQDYFENAERCN